MRLHVKLSLTLLSGLIVIIVIAQIVQYAGSVKLISNLSENSIDILKEREEQAVRNIFRSVERSVSGSLERGEMEKFSKLLEAQKEVEGLLEFSLYDRQGQVTHSSDPAFITNMLPEELHDRLFSDSSQLLRYTDGAVETYQPQVVIRDCTRCHKTWQVGSICGVTSMKFSTEALAKAELRAAEAITITEQTFLRNSLGILCGTILVFMIMMVILVRRNIATPLNTLVRAARQIVEGNVDIQLPDLSSRNEIGTLTRAFKNMIAYLQRMADVATKISTGDFHHNVSPRTKNDVLGQAFLNMSTYLNEMETTAGAIAQGDLTQTARIRSAEDAFGKVIQSMTEGLWSLIVQIRTSAEQIASIESKVSLLTADDLSIAQEVSRAVKQMISTVRDLAASVEEVARNMEVLSSSVEETSASVTQMTPSIKHIVSNTTTLTQQIQQTREFLTETISALEQIVDSTETSKHLSQATIQDALDGQEAMTHVTTSMETVQETIATAMDAITSFSQRSQDIGSILDVISEIADQTSLLALNASIIAAQAGQHGRAFTVVAEEMKTLATGVTQSTKDITEIIHTLQQETTKVVHTIHTGAEDVEQGMQRTRQAQETLQNIIASARRSSSIVTEISEALNGLMTSSHGIAAEMKQVNAMTDEINTATSEQEISTVHIHQAIEHINEMSSQIQHATTYQSAGLQQVLQTTTDVTALIDQNSESSHKMIQATKDLIAQSELLLQSVDRFKLNS